MSTGIFTSASGSVPTGTVVMFGGAAAPSADWLLLDGSAVSRTTYAGLFSILSTTYGIGDGSTTFNLPNTQGVFIRGAGTQTISAIGYTGTRGTAQGDQMQGHLHGPITGATAYGGIGGSGSNLSGPGAASAANTGTPVSDGGNGTPRTGTETRPANIVLSYIIKT